MFFSLCNFTNCSGIVIDIIIIIIIIIGVGGTEGGLIGFGWGSSSSKYNVEVCVFVYLKIFVRDVFLKTVLFQVPLVMVEHLLFTLLTFLIYHMAIL
jgi:hypothetical protein